MTMSDIVPADNDFNVEMVALAELRPHPRNYKGHPQAQVEHLAESLRAYGYYRNVVIARDGTILAGHGVVKAALAKGRTMVPVKRLDLDPMEPAALKVVALDNEVTRMAEVDDAALSKLLEEIRDSDVTGLLGTGFDEASLARFIVLARDEVTDFDASQHWAGMPEMTEGEARLELLVNFRDDQDKRDFYERLGITVPLTQKRIWWPPGKDDLTAVEYQDAQS